MAQLQAVGGGSREAKGPVVCVRDAMKNLKVMGEDAQAIPTTVRFPGMLLR